MPLPKLLYTTAENHRVYPFVEVNGRQMTELHIDPHYEEEHSEYMNDEKIYQLVYQLAKISAPIIYLIKKYSGIFRDKNIV